jgi:cytochrome P450
MSATVPTATLRRIVDLPTPPGLPWVGQLFSIRPPTIHQQVEAWARDLGPLFRVQFASRRMLVVADHALASAVMRDRPEGFERSPLSRRISSELGMPGGVFSAEGEDWQRQRRMVMASFSPTHVRAYFPSLVRVARRLQARWRRAAQADAPIVLQADLMRFTVDVISGLAFGRDINTLESGDDVIQRHLDKVLPAIFRRAFSRVPTWRYFKTERDRQLDHSIGVIRDTVAGFVAEARQRLRDDPGLQAQPRNLLEAMILAADEPGSGLGDSQVAGNVVTMLLAGEDTTANTLAWMIDLLHRNPLALGRLQDEVRVAIPSLDGLTIDALDSMSYLDACASETMRLKPVAPFMILHALRDSTIGDVAVPRGTMVWIAMRHDSVSDRHFTDPWAFRPERWLAASEPALTSAARRSAMPFGSGPRMCPGRYLALLEIKLAMAMLLSSFDIASVETPDGQPAAERMAFTMNPVGLSMRLRERAA